MLFRSQGAADLHLHQIRMVKPVPDLWHLIGGSSLVWGNGGIGDQAIVNLLHDAIEEAGESRAAICERYGETVAEYPFRGIRRIPDPLRRSTSATLYGPLSSLKLRRRSQFRPDFTVAFASETLYVVCRRNPHSISAP